MSTICLREYGQLSFSLSCSWERALRLWICCMYLRRNSTSVSCVESLAVFLLDHGYMVGLSSPLRLFSQGRLSNGMGEVYGSA